jgi:hypothetical protein
VIERSLILACVLLIAGCGGGGEPASRTVAPAGELPSQTPATATGEATDATTETEPSEEAEALAGAGTDPVTVRATNAETALLTAVRAARHVGYDRVVFEFANELPGYDIRYAKGPIVADGSGTRVDVKGRYALQIRMENALDADLSKPSAPRTYTGPPRFTPDAGEIAELVRTGGFEGVLTWVAGLRNLVEFRVTTLVAPARLVLDVRTR